MGHARSNWDSKRNRRTERRPSNLFPEELGKRWEEVSERVPDGVGTRWDGVGVNRLPRD